jgi:peroxiredoxin
MEEKKFNLKAAILVSLAVVIALVLVSLLQNDSALVPVKLSSIPEGIPAPDFTFPDLNGRNISLSDYKGKVVLINIWATWCPPCVYEMPSMEKLYKEFKGENFEILAVSIDTGGKDIVAPFIKKYKLTFPALIDPKGTIKTLYGVTGVPESYIIDKQGIIIEKIIGGRDWAAPEIFRFFNSLIQKPLHGKNPDQNTRM